MKKADNTIPEVFFQHSRFGKMGFSEYIKPCLFVILYWASFVINGVFFSDLIITQLAVFHVILFLLSLFSGYIFYYHIRTSFPRAQHPLKSYSFSDRHLLILNFFIFFFLLYLAHRSGAFKYSFVDYFTLVRAGGEDSIYAQILLGFGNPVLSLFLQSVIFPIFTFTQISIFSMKFNQKRKKLLFFFVAANSIFFAYIFQSGFLVMPLFYAAIVSAFFGTHSRKEILINILALTIIMVFLFIYLKIRTKELSFFDSIDFFFTYYNTIGISRYSVKLQDFTSILHSPSYGGSVLGSLGLIINKYLTSMGIDLSFMLKAMAGNVIESKEGLFIGYYKDGVAVYPNAFNTLLFEFYRDFNFVGIIIYSFLIGVFFGFSKYKSVFDDTKLFYFYSTFIFLLMSIGMSVFLRTFFGFFLILTPILIKIVTIQVPLFRHARASKHDRGEPPSAT